YYSIDKPINEPKGVQKPHIPLWIGGGGEKVTLKLVAKWGNACNIGGDADTLRHKFEVLRGHCADLSRNYDESVRSTSLNLCLLGEGADPEQATKAARGAKSYKEFSRDYTVGTADQIARQIEPLIDAGANYILVYFPRIAYDQEMLRRFAQDVMPRFT